MLRTEILRELEKLRASKVIGSSQEASIRLGSDSVEDRVTYEGLKEQIETICMVSEVHVDAEPPADAVRLTNIPTAWVHARKSPHAKCERCWNLRPTVGQSAEHPTLCDRCVRVVSELNAGA